MIGLKNLATLNLSGTQISDAGLTQISRLKNLTRLILPQNELITDPAIDDLRKSLPKLVITH